MPGSIRPIEPGLSGPTGGWPVPGEQVSVMPQPLLQLLADLALEEVRDLHRQRRAAGADGDSEEKSRLSRSGSAAIAIHIVGTPGK